MKRIYSIILCSVIVCSVFMFGGCGLYEADAKQEISRILEIDMSKADEVSFTDTHGGFLGDGETMAVYSFSDNSVEDEIKSNQHWRNSASINLSTIMYGDAETISFFEDENGNNFFPTVENGYYFVYDRHSDAKKTYSDNEILDIEHRYSYNFSVALYDCDTDTLYFAELDT